MDAFDWLAIICLFLIGGTALYLAWLLFEWPGIIAKERNHPNATAIRACGWLGLVTGMLFWAGAMVWALVGETSTRKAQS